MGGVNHKLSSFQRIFRWWWVRRSTMKVRGFMVMLDCTWDQLAYNGRWTWHTHTYTSLDENSFVCKILYPSLLTTKTTVQKLKTCGWKTILTFHCMFGELVSGFKLLFKWLCIDLQGKFPECLQPKLINIICSWVLLALLILFWEAVQWWI